MTKAEEITKGNGFESHGSFMYYGDCLRAVNEALEWAANQCEKYGSQSDSNDLFTKESVTYCMAKLIREGK